MIGRGIHWRLLVFAVCFYFALFAAVFGVPWLFLGCFVPWQAPTAEGFRLWLALTVMCTAIVTAARS